MKENPPSETKCTLIGQKKSLDRTGTRKAYSPPLVVGIGEVSVFTRFDVSVIAG